jgi:hypothetical protein
MDRTNTKGKIGITSSKTRAVDREKNSDGVFVAESVRGFGGAGPAWFRVRQLGNQI